MESKQWTTIANKTITGKPLDSGQRWNYFLNELQNSNADLKINVGES